MRVLVIGLGSIGRRHAENLEMLGHEVIGCDEKTAAQLDAEWVGMPAKGITVYKDFLQALKLSPDAAIICSPPAWHHTHGVRALTECNVFVEKPLAISRQGAVQLCREAELYERVLGVGYMLRAHIVATRVKAKIANGDFGKIHTVIFECCWQPKRTTYDWPGVLWETSHEIDLAYWLLGSLTVPHAQPGISAHCADFTLFAGTTTVLFHLDTISPHYRRSVTVYGDKHSERFEFSANALEWAQAYYAEMQAFLAGKPFCTGREALETVEIVARLHYDA